MSCLLRVAAAHRAERDDQTIALWAVAGAEGEPGTWAPRAAALRTEAERLLEQNLAPLAAAARRLYQDGHLEVSELDDLTEGEDAMSIH